MVVEIYNNDGIHIWMNNKIINMKWGQKCFMWEKQFEKKIFYP